MDAQPARQLFDELATSQGMSGALPMLTDAMIVSLEHELAGSIGAALTYAMVQRFVGHESISMTELIDIADQTQRLIETSHQLSEKSLELSHTATQLREANARLRNLGAQKDDFLSQVSHELRTPMTSIRSLSEILLTTYDVASDERRRFMMRANV